MRAARDGGLSLSLSLSLPLPLTHTLTNTYTHSHSHSHSHTLSLSHTLTYVYIRIPPACSINRSRPRTPFFFFVTLVTGPRRSFLSDTRVYEPQIRARLGTTAHLLTLNPPSAQHRSIASSNASHASPSPTHSRCVCV